jgi:hypothetical protein
MHPVQCTRQDCAKKNCVCNDDHPGKETAAMQCPSSMIIVARVNGACQRIERTYGERWRLFDTLVIM